jgi:outer membrane protein assembly factor BamD
MQKYKDKDYLEAIDDFKAITVQYQGSEYADEAEFLMGECRFLRGEYILAASEFDILIRTRPSSNYVTRARYMEALSYYKLSPKSSLDQKYTLQAIDDFQAYLENSPNDSLVNDAENKISELNDKLAKKEFDNGRLYYKLEYYRAAVEYFNLVLDQYHDTPYAPRALVWKARSLKEHRDYAAALNAVNQFFDNYPNNDLHDDALELKSEIEKALARTRHQDPQNVQAANEAM